MAEDITISLDTLPDKDSFLPRYLTVQLLEVLAANANSQTTDSASYTLQNAKFVDSFKNKELFTPLTYSIFWREKIQKAIETNELSFDETDQYNRAPLTLAIANEDFALAVELIKKNASLMLEDKLVLEIALISMIQRDPNFISKVLQNKAENDVIWLKEYLEYLQSYILGQPKKTKLLQHEVLNPPLRQFGQVLDTLAYFNGLPSHYGFLSPSIEILSTHLKQFCQETDNTTPYKDMLYAISDAYATTAQACQYYGNLPTNADAAKVMTQKIQSNLNSNKNGAVVLFGGWAGNSIAVAFVRDVLIFSNLGIGGTPAAGTKIFRITKPENITEQVIDTFIRGLGNATAPYIILDQIGSIVDPKPLFTIKQSFNPIDNCIFVNPRAVIQGLILVLSALNKDGKITEGNLTGFNSQAAEIFTTYVNSLYKYSTADLSKFMRNHQLLQNRRIECCALALDYINQHYQEPEALSRCIELKNALEFVGLKDFYTSSIEPAAKNAIQELMIHEQEATAIHVIQQENDMIASSNKNSS